MPGSAAPGRATTVGTRARSRRVRLNAAARTAELAPLLPAAKRNPKSAGSSKARADGSPFVEDMLPSSPPPQTTLEGSGNSPRAQAGYAEFKFFPAEELGARRPRRMRGGREDPFEEAAATPMDEGACKDAPREGEANSTAPARSTAAT